MNGGPKAFRPTEYRRAESLDEAVRLLAQAGSAACPIAGGTDLIVEKDPTIQTLVDVTSLGLDFIRLDEKGLVIGAATRIADIGTSSVLGGPYQILAEAARELGTPQIRNMATLGGNLCRPSPAADMAPPLLVLEAILQVVGVRGERRVRIDEFFKGVKKDGLEPGEILAEIHLPPVQKSVGTAFLKKGRVAAGDLSVVSVAAWVSKESDGRCEEARIALGSVAPVPLRVRKAESLLKGKAPNQELLKRVAEEASGEITPISDIRSSSEYRRTLSRALVERALIRALERVS